jgi:hypothetical protein
LILQPGLPLSPEVTLEEMMDVLRELRVQEGPDGLPKRHQPLALLWAIGRARHGQRLTPWPDARAQIGDLISRFGRPTDQRNPNLPVLALNRTALFELKPRPPEGIRQEALREWLRNTRPSVCAGLSEPVCKLLITDSDAAAQVVVWLLDSYFETTHKDRLLQATALNDLGGSVYGRQVRQWPETGPAAGRQRMMLIVPFDAEEDVSRWSATTEKYIEFSKQPVRDCLSAEELEMLLAVHPEGKALFWGAPTSCDSEISRLATGDPILFTQDGLPDAVGWFGCKLNNRALADALWGHDPGLAHYPGTDWGVVYTILEIVPENEVVAGDIRLTPGYSPTGFETLKVTSPQETASLISAFGFGVEDTENAKDKEEQTAEALIHALNTGSNLIAAEANHVSGTEYQRTPGNVIVRRGEAQLVSTYLRTLPAHKAKRLQLAVGLTDLYDEETADIIEAKVSAEHRYVRQALGQLLDYAAHCAHPLKRLTALFPAQPSPADIQLLHRYGIDCLYWAGDAAFRRLEAPADARQRIRAAWSHR